MAASHLSAVAPSSRLTRSIGWGRPGRTTSLFLVKHKCKSHVEFKGLSCRGSFRHCHWSADSSKLFSSVGITKRKRVPFVGYAKVSSDYDVVPCHVDDERDCKEEAGLSSSTAEVYVPDNGSLFQSDPLDAKRELLLLSLPAIAGQALDPLAQLMEMAYIGRLGPVELASAGVSTSIFNIVSKLFNIPLLSVATSFVAEDLSRSMKASSHNEVHLDKEYERMQLASVSTALLLAVGIGIFEALALFLGSGIFIDLMGIPNGSPMHAPARRFLTLRALGAPAVVISLALQGVLRGFKDTKTPVFCLGVGNFSAVFLLPVLVYYFQLGLTGAAISTVISQYIVAFLMIWDLNKRAILLPPKLTDLRFGVYMKSGGFLLGRTLAVLITMTIGTSMAARQGPVAMAAHQICLQIWLAVSLLTDALATSGQALIVGYVSKGEYKTVKELTYFVLKIGLITGASLAFILGLGYGSLLSLFTKDLEVLAVATAGVLFVSASQPINALAYIFDGLHFGLSDFRYAALSMMVAGAISSAVLLYAPGVIGLRGVWLGLTLLMGLRTVAGFVRLSSKNGPWWFLHGDSPAFEMGGSFAS
ncbi:hypothetical protein Droror1_Dr00005848 [Drosera rotundifolia]